MGSLAALEIILGATAYLIFVFFLHRQNFWRIKFTPKKRVNYDKIHRKLPIFCVITANSTINCQFFALNLQEFTLDKKIYTRILVAFVTNMRCGEGFAKIFFHLFIGAFLVNKRSQFPPNIEFQRRKKGCTSCPNWGEGKVIW